MDKIWFTSTYRSISGIAGYIVRCGDVQLVLTAQQTRGDEPPYTVYIPIDPDDGEWPETREPPDGLLSLGCPPPELETPNPFQSWIDYYSE